MNTIVSQALALGLPVVTTRHSGLPEQVTDGENGFLVSEGDFAALADRILELCEHPELVRALSERARERVRLRYNATTLIDEQIAQYRRLVDGRE